MAGRRRILYIDLAAGVGGSVLSLYELVKGLDRGRYEPYVLLRASNPYVERFRGLGVEVHTLESGTPAEGSPQTRPWGADIDLVERVRRSCLVRGLRRNELGERLVHFVGFYARTYPRLRQEARKLTEIIRILRPDLVHLNDAVCVSRAGIMAARRVGVPAICHVRAMERRNHFDRWLSRSLVGLICISRAVEEHERRQGGRVEPRWVVYNGLDLAAFAWSDDGADTRAELGLGPGDRVVGCVGRLVAWKGQGVFLRALFRLKERFPALWGVIVGEAAKGDTTYVQELYELTRQLGLEGRVLFTGFRQDIPRLLRAMDVLVHASTAPEPFGRVLIEGMAAGTPVIGTNAGAVPEVIEDKVTGLLVPPGDEEALAEAIAWILDHPYEAQRMRLAARDAVALRFTTERYVRGIERVYEEILR